jgi:hypothetical protein
MPKENSKTQQKKKEDLLKNPINYVVCKKCGKKNTTLFKVDGDYYCKEHKI